VTTTWRRLWWIVPLLGTVGCGQFEPVPFSHLERLEGEEFAEAPNLRDAVIQSIDDMFGDSPYRLKVPEGSGLPEGGRYLAAYSWEPTGPEPDGERALRAIAYVPAGADPSDPRELVQIEGGQALYHRHCLHCHGVSGDGEGPTAPFLYPRPRDYRPGMFKFTSTEFGGKPTRDDLERTIRDGIHGTSMPAFGAQLTDAQIAQVIDYVMFLSMRGEVERALTEEAAFLSDEDFDADGSGSLDDEERAELYDEIGLIAEEIAAGPFGVFASWKQSEERLFTPLTPRVPSSQASIDRGRELFLGATEGVKLECAGCHGLQAQGNGPSWIDRDTFERYVFTLDPLNPAPIEELAEVAEERQRRWGDEWGDPLRPADLNRGVYKGGRRPIDIYWRVATGITGTPMPEHAAALRENPDDLWHLVNFVLALPHEPDLLRPDRLEELGVEEPPPVTTTTAAAADGAAPVR